MNQFAGMIALVTGGTRGIGFKIAKDLHDLGATVIITGTKESSIDRIRSEFDGGKGLVEFYEVDFLDLESIN